MNLFEKIEIHVKKKTEQEITYMAPEVRALVEKGADLALDIVLPILIKVIDQRNDEIYAHSHLVKHYNRDVSYEGLKQIFDDRILDCLK